MQEHIMFTEPGVYDWDVPIGTHAGVVTVVGGGGSGDGDDGEASSFGDYASASGGRGGQDGFGGDAADAIMDREVNLEGVKTVRIVVGAGGGLGENRGGDGLVMFLPRNT